MGTAFLWLGVSRTWGEVDQPPARARYAAYRRMITITRRASRPIVIMRE